MILVILAAIVFGFVHPGAKLILDTGIDLFSFCELYVLIRLIVQVPIAIKTGAWRVKNFHQLKLLLAVGTVGALLQLTEFMGLSKGLPVPIVTFLVYSHPIWSLLFSRVINKEPFSVSSYIKLALGLSGIALIAGAQLSQVSLYDSYKFLAPILAGLLIALWVSLSNKTKKQENTSSWTISFYYDLFALGALFIIGKFYSSETLSSGSLGSWLSHPEHIASIIFYSIAVGLLPNLLFYQGSQKVAAFRSSLILLLEPLVACFVSSLIWHDSLALSFFVGATFIFLSATPIESLKFKLRRSVAIPFMAILFVAIPSRSHGALLHVVEIVPTTQNDYAVSKEIEQIKLSYKLALQDYKKLDKKCSPPIKEKVSSGTDEELFSYVSEIAGDGGVLVGLSRSNFARIGAKAAQGKPLQGISIGAAAANIATINPNFTSIVSPLTSQWEALFREMSMKKCAPSNTTGVFDSGEFLSSEFKKLYLNLFKTAVENSKFEPDKIKGASCVFIALNFSQAQEYLTKIPNEKIEIFGVGDWNYFAKELRELLHNQNKQNWTVTVPTGWKPDMTPRARAFSARIQQKLKDAPSPVAAYTYDSTLIGLKALCEKKKIQDFTIRDLKGLPLLRDYSGRTASNLISKMNIIKIEGDREK